jgi:hypothetical protein
MRGVVLGDGPDPQIRNDDASERGALRRGECQQYRSTHRHRALCRARRHRAVSAAGLAIAPVGKRLAAARVGNRIPHARAHGRRIRQGRPLENRGKNQGDSEKATVHGGQSVLERQRQTT